MPTSMLRFSKRAATLRWLAENKDTVQKLRPLEVAAKLATAFGISRGAAAQRLNKAKQQGLPVQTVRPKPQVDIDPLQKFDANKRDSAERDDNLAQLKKLLEQFSREEIITALKVNRAVNAAKSPEKLLGALEALTE